DRESEKEGSVLGRETAAEAGPDQGTSSPSSSGQKSFRHFPDKSRRSCAACP
ncbi:hypothetical protein CHARACLAT_017372, partial [Characodon lateralis]|nr:hypothetical protein [Characodon lateralis]